MSFYCIFKTHILVHFLAVADCCLIKKDKTRLAVGDSVVLFFVAIVPDF